MAQFRRFQGGDPTVSVAPASRRLLALSRNSNTAGKMPALLQENVAPLRINYPAIRRHLETDCGFKLRHSQIVLPLGVRGHRGVQCLPQCQPNKTGVPSNPAVLLNEAWNDSMDPSSRASPRRQY
jgi:hypothetical protein